jgi:xanthine dehydrogenase accessory factor
MTDLDQILPLWQQLRESRAEYVLATVVMVEGSGYRKPGARMLIAADGRRAGTISGGCLEAEVARKAFWRTEHGSVVRRYSTAAEDGEVPYGMGCGGIVHLLLERSATAEQMMERMAASFEQREPLTIATVLEGDHIGQRAYWPNRESDTPDDAASRILAELACRGFEERQSFSHSVQIENGELTAVRVEWNAARLGLFVFGAGDDAIPLVRQARQLGWYVAVADGRSHLVTQARFPEAHAVHMLVEGELSALGLRPGDVATVMTHSLEQDTRFLSALLKEELAYLGVLGPRRRTEEMLLALALKSGVAEALIDTQTESWMERVHAPMGLDLGGNTPADIALATIAEIQQCRHRTSGLALRVVRARRKAIA